jgi:phosphoribosylanthranilate isomerase
MVGIGVEGAIIGTALYVGRFTIEEALAAAQLDSTTGSNDT